MPSCRFFAVGDDARAVFGAILDEANVQLFEQYSAQNAALRAFTSVEDAAAAYASGVLGFSVYAPACGGQFVPRRIALQADKFGSNAFRHELSGWGALNLQFGVLTRGRLRLSSLSCNSEARARRWAEALAGDLGPVAGWHWPEVARVARRTMRAVRRLGVARVGSVDVLPMAQSGLTRQEFALDLHSPAA